MFYPDEIVEKVRVENDIVDVIGQYVSLKPKGNTYFGLCPFHREKTPSFSVSADKQLFHCFGCGASGNVISFVMQKENYDFPTAVKALAERARITLPEEGYSPEAKKEMADKKLIKEAHKLAARFYYDNLVGPSGLTAREYLINRKIADKTLVKYGLGYSGEQWDRLTSFLRETGYKDQLLLKSGLALKNKQGGLYDRFRNRLMFPIFDVTGDVIGFGGRIIGNGEPKYLNSPESPVFEKSKNLYNLNFARKLKPDELILVEGYMDVIGLYQAGVGNAVASLGTAFNNNHARVLKKFTQNVTVLFDSDEAGEKATEKAIPVLIENGLRVKVVRLNGAKDPDEFANKFGNEQLRQAIQGAISHVAFSIGLMKNKYDIDSDVGKIDFTVEAAKLLTSLPGDIERDVYTGEVARLTGISEEAIKREITKNNKTVRNVNDKRRLNYNLTERNMLLNKGLEEARKAVLFYSSQDEKMCRAILSKLSPVELGEPVYARLLTMLNDCYEKGVSIYPAEIVSRFESPEDQKLVSNVFLTVITPESMEDKLKAVTEHVRQIKASYVDKLMNRPDIDDVELKSLIEEKRNLVKLYISP